MEIRKMTPCRTEAAVSSGTNLKVVLNWRTGSIFEMFLGAENYLKRFRNEEL